MRLEVLVGAPLLVLAEWLVRMPGDGAAGEARKPEQRILPRRARSRVGVPCDSKERGPDGRAVGEHRRENGLGAGSWIPARRDRHQVTCRLRSRYNAEVPRL